ncbi:MAG: hypothetical protein K6C08_10880, partial [Oscillospiraceae bacterium]|nr:hypothetical protein [Oscillospiraceae bacterium]
SACDDQTDGSCENSSRKQTSHSTGTGVGKKFCTARTAPFPTRLLPDDFMKSAQKEQAKKA